ncbi:putative plant-specific domain TIGR01615 family protein-like [Panicum miliaceum]|uniref:Plant-specific domain TIGR01615 family protein-like n=1 Tax=Panicum miliaceum TaxID=4540 RepID=A0A3L6PFY6_PANMI|nr:putative plant-specific domain TIGR01615 family protein-like [Panicum miliaceum]
MSKWKGLSAFHFSGNCGGSGGGHTYTSLSSLLHSFLEQGCSSSSSTTNANLGNSDEGAASPARASCEGVRPDAVAMEDKAIIKKSAERITILLDQGMADDSFLVRLASDVAKAAADMASLRSTRSELQRAVVFRLREEGYDAAICQTSWRATQDVSTGNYEYIDVVSMVHGKATTTSGERYIVDLGFTTEFAVARPTAAYAYALLLEALPSVLVARPNVMRQVVKVAGKEARRSLKDQGLTVPPWRKKRFMAAKWFSPHRQMAETVTGRHRAPVVASGDAMCRTVGFVLGPPVQPWLRYYAL